MIRKLFLAGLATLSLAASASADKVGQELPEFQLEGLSQTPAKSYDEFTGRLVLIEFFAYW
jgi:hypothetical protein